MTQTAQINVKCPVCGGDLEAGYIPDFGHSRVYRLSWVPGTPEPSLFFGDIKWPGNARFPLEAFRCTGCGYVLLFAHNRPA